MCRVIERGPEGANATSAWDVEAESAGVAEAVLAAARSIRYVAVSVGGVLVTKVAEGRENASAAESDYFEEVLVNPTMLGLAARRGQLGCGGLDYVVVRYGHFFQLVIPAADGHLSVCVEPDANPTELVPAICDAGRTLVTTMRQPPSAAPGSRLAPEPFIAGDRPSAGTRRLLRALYDVSDEVRYVALKTRGRLLLSSRVADPGSSADHSDRYEELLVNPTLLAMAAARGGIDCGGLRFLIVAYPAFFALVLPLPGDHATVSLPRSTDPVGLAPAFEAVLSSEGVRPGRKRLGKPLAEPVAPGQEPGRPAFSRS